MSDFGGSQFSNVPKQLLNAEGGAFSSSLGKRFDRGGRGGRGGHHGRGGGGQQFQNHHGHGAHMPVHTGPMTSIVFAGHIVSYCYVHFIDQLLIFYSYRDVRNRPVA